MDCSKKPIASILKVFHGLEILLAALVIMAVLIGSYFFLAQLLDVAVATSIDVKMTLEELLSDLLILVVGVELAIMLIKRTPESLIEIMFFVVARKLIIISDSAVELLLGVVALAGLFAIEKYLMVGRSQISK